MTDGGSSSTCRSRGSFWSREFNSYLKLFLTLLIYNCYTINAFVVLLIANLISRNCDFSYLEYYYIRYNHTFKQISDF
jgi:hypothetical protein